MSSCHLYLAHIGPEATVPVAHSAWEFPSWCEEPPRYILQLSVIFSEVFRLTPLAGAPEAAHYNACLMS